MGSLREVAGSCSSQNERYDVDPGDLHTYGLLSKYQGISHLWLHQPNPARIAAQPFSPQQPIVAPADVQCLPPRHQRRLHHRRQRLRPRPSLAWRHR